MLAKHISGRNKFKCNLCKRVRSSKSSLKKHSCKMESMQPSQCKHICGICGDKFSTVLGLRNHKNMHANTLILCKICDEIFETEKDLEIHLIYSTECKQKTRKKFIPDLTCDLCDKVLNNNKSYRLHMRNKHSQAEVARHKCKRCCLVFNKEVSVGEHECDIEDMTCDYCAKIFFRKQSRGPFDCEVCGRLLKSYLLSQRGLLFLYIFNLI